MYLSSAGSILQMINSLKDNRALLKRIRPFQRNTDSQLYKYGISDVEFKTISEEDLLAFRQKLRKERRKKDIFLAILFILCFGLVFSLFYLILTR